MINGDGGGNVTPFPGGERPSDDNVFGHFVLHAVLAGLPVDAEPPPGVMLHTDPEFTYTVVGWDTFHTVQEQRAHIVSASGEQQPISASFTAIVNPILLDLQMKPFVCPIEVCVLVWKRLTLRTLG